MNEFKTITEEMDALELTIGTEKILIKKLSVRKVVNVSKVISKLLIKYAAKLKTFRTDTKTNLEDIFQLIDIIEPEELGAVLSVIIDKPAEYCLDLSFKTVSDIITYIYERNYEDIKELLKNWQGILAKTPESQNPAITG